MKPMTAQQMVDATPDVVPVRAEPDGKCTKCSGSGILIGDIQCNQCGGSGAIDPGIM